MSCKIRRVHVVVGLGLLTFICILVSSSLSTVQSAARSHHFRSPASTTTTARITGTRRKRRNIPRNDVDVDDDDDDDDDDGDDENDDNDDNDDGDGDDDARQSSGAEVDVTTGLIAWWTFSSESSSAAVDRFDDRSGCQRHAVLSAKHGMSHDVNQRRATLPCLGAGKDNINNVLFLNAHRQHYLRVENSKSMHLSTRFTWSAWIYPFATDGDASSSRDEGVRGGGGDATGWQVIFDNGLSGKYHAAWGWRILKNTIAFDVSGGNHRQKGQQIAHNYPGAGSNSPSADALMETRIEPNMWHHIAIVYGNGHTGIAMEPHQQWIRIYRNAKVIWEENLLQHTLNVASSQSDSLGRPRDGRKCTTSKWSTPCERISPGKPKADLWIGREAPNRRKRGYTGLMDDIRIYGNRSLSPTEIAALMQCRVAHDHDNEMRDGTTTVPRSCPSDNGN